MKKLVPNVLTKNVHVRADAQVTKELRKNYKEVIKALHILAENKNKQQQLELKQGFCKKN